LANEDEDFVLVLRSVAYPKGPRTLLGALCMYALFWEILFWETVFLLFSPFLGLPVLPVNPKDLFNHPNGSTLVRNLCTCSGGSHGEGQLNRKARMACSERKSK
jgi:hypothetical protein